MKYFILAISIFLVGGVVGAQRGDWVSMKAEQALRELFDADGNISVVTYTATVASPTTNPLSGAVKEYWDDNTDWSGGGGNDCAKVAHAADGTKVVMTIIVLNGVCP